MQTSKNYVSMGMWPEMAKQLGKDFPNTLSSLPTVAAGGTLTATAGHANKVILLDTATGSVVTLPAATGTLNTYFFRTSVTVTSNNHIVKVANSTDIMRGTLAVHATTGLLAATTVDADTITLNGTTTGGVLSTIDFIAVFDVASGLFLVSGSTKGSGTAATVFSATV